MKSYKQFSEEYENNKSLNEETAMQVEFSFPNIGEYRKAEKSLIGSKFYRSGNGNPPTSSQVKNSEIFIPDERFLTITVPKKQNSYVKSMFDALMLSFKTKMKKASKYEIFNQGGYLD